MDPFGNLDSRKFYKIDVGFHGLSGAQPWPHVRAPLKKGIRRVLRYGDVSPKNYSPTLHPQHLVKNELWWNGHASWRYNCSLIFPTTLSEPVAEWAPNFLAGWNTNYSRKKEEGERQTAFENKLQSGECSYQPPTNLLSRQRIRVGWFQGHRIPHSTFMV